jgi:signal transduction histidine kinase
MTRAAHTISIHDLSRRLPIPQTGDEIQRVAETWNEVLTRLESAVLHLTQFTSDISHDLRTTITVMHSTAQLALRRTRSADKYQEALNTVVLECEATSALLDDLLTASRSDIAQQNISLAPVSLSSVVEEACDHFRPRTEIKLQTLQAHLQTEAWLLGDRSLVRRLVMILLDNAMKYTPERGTITVTVSASGKNALLEVQDNGIGIATTEIGRVFERFYRADSSRNRDEGGSGLGLAIAKWIAESHQAQIVLRSEPNQGSTFVISFPVCSPTLCESRK